MKLNLPVILTLLVNLPTGVALAQQDGEQLLTEKMCYACHQLEAASLGPPWRAIAARHVERRDVMLDVLAGKIVRGGGGNWGLVPMVPNQRVSDDEALLMTQWILDQSRLSE